MEVLLSFLQVCKSICKLLKVFAAFNLFCFICADAFTVFLYSSSTVLLDDVVNIFLSFVCKLFIILERPETESMDRWDQGFARRLYLCDTNFIASRALELLSLTECFH